MRLTVLGRNGAYPAHGGATSGYLLSLDGANILIDCGSGVLANLLKLFDKIKLDAIILTHLHHDHIADVGPLTYCIGLSKLIEVPTQGLPVYLPDAPAEQYHMLQRCNGLQLHPIQYDCSFKLCGARISLSKVDHPVPTFAVRVSEHAEFVFSADSRYCPALVALATQADFLMSDAAVPAAQHKPAMPHMSITEAARTAQEAQVKRLLLTHLMTDASEQELLEEAQAIFPQTDIAKEMMVYEIT